MFQPLVTQQIAWKITMFNRSVIELHGPCSIPKWNSHRVSFTSPAKNITSLASRFRRYSKARKLCRRTAWRLGFPKKESMDKVESFWSYKWRFEREKHRKTSENPGEIHEQNGGLVRENHRTTSPGGNLPQNLWTYPTAWHTAYPTTPRTYAMCKSPWHTGPHGQVFGLVCYFPKGFGTFYISSWILWPHPKCQGTHGTPTNCFLSTQALRCNSHCRNNIFNL